MTAKRKTRPPVKRRKKRLPTKNAYGHVKSVGGRGIKHEPTKEQRALVKTLIVAGWPHMDIAEVIGVSMDTLRSAYDNELNRAKAEADAAVTNSLLMQAIGGPTMDWTKAIPAATIWYTKAQMKWQEPPSRNVNLNGSYDLSSLSLGKLEEIRELLAAIPAIAPPADAGGSRRGDRAA